MRLLYLESGRLSSLPFTIFEKFSEKLRMLAGVRSEFSISPEVIVGRMPVDDLEDHRFGGSVMIDTGNHVSAAIAGFPFGGESLAPVHHFGDRRVRLNRNGDDVAGHVVSSSEGEIGFEKCWASPLIGPLSAAILVHDPDWSIVGRGVDHRDVSRPSIAFDGEFVRVDIVGVVRVLHASIVPEEEEKGKRSGGKFFNNSTPKPSLGDTDFFDIQIISGFVPWPFTLIDDRLGALLVFRCDDIKAAIFGGPVVSGQGNGKEESVLHECIIPEEERKASHFREKA